MAMVNGNKAIRATPHTGSPEEMERGPRAEGRGASHGSLFGPKAPTRRLRMGGPADGASRSAGPAGDVFPDVSPPKH